MKEKEDSYKALLALASQMGGMLYWRYFCSSSTLDFPIQQINRLLNTSFVENTTNNKQQDPIKEFILLISENERDEFRSILYGRTPNQEGIFYYHLCVNGNPFLHKIKYSRITENGEEVVIGIIQDITLFKKQEERNAKIIEAIPDFIFIFDKSFFIRDVLKSNEITLLHPVEYLIGIDGRKIYSADVSQLFINSIHQCLENKKIQKIEYPLDTEDGMRHYFQARMVPFDSDKVMALIHDIGERVRYTQELIEARKKAEDADKMKSTFLANMSHEIRTPLNAIVGFSEILPETDSEEERTSYIHIIRRNSDLLLQLIDDILDLSRLESGKALIHCLPTNLNRIANEVIRVYQMKVPAQITLFSEIPHDEIIVNTDSNRVTQVLFNFMSNALKNTTQGSITLKMTIQNGFAQLSVEDTGCGISEENLSRIFKRFTKLNDFAQGTGLGLTICQNIIEKLGGRIDVSSTLGEGSKFSFTLPMEG